MGEQGDFGAALSAVFGLELSEGEALAKRLLAHGASLIRRFGVSAEESQELLQVALARALEQRRHEKIDNPYGWMSVVMRHELLRRLGWSRRRQGWTEGEDRRQEEEQASARAEVSQALEARGAALRAVLDKIAWEPTRSNGVHYFAVLLLALRLNALARYDAALDEPVRAALEAVVRWHKVECGWRLASAQWPRLQACWELVVRQAQRSSLSLSEALRLLEEELAPGLRGVWHQWRKRAAREALQRCTSEERALLEGMLVLRGEAA